MWRTTTCAVPPSTSIDTPMFWAVQRGSATGLARGNRHLSRYRPLRRHHPARAGAWLGGADGIDGASDRTAITPAAITQVSRRRVILGIRVPRLGRFGPPPPARKGMASGQSRYSGTASLFLPATVPRRGYRRRREGGSPPPSRVRLSRYFARWRSSRITAATPETETPRFLPSSESRRPPRR